MKRSYPFEFPNDAVPNFSRSGESPRTNPVNDVSKTLTWDTPGRNSGRIASGHPTELSKQAGDSSTTQGQDQTWIPNWGKSLIEKTYYFTGSADRVIKWSRVFKERCYFEVISSVVSIRDGSIQFQTIILLKDAKSPVLQVIHYKNHQLNEEDFNPGEMLRCVGYMSGPNTFTAFSVRKATPDEVATLKRYCYIGDFTISRLINAEEHKPN